MPSTASTSGMVATASSSAARASTGTGGRGASSFLLRTPRAGRIWSECAPSAPVSSLARRPRWGEFGLFGVSRRLIRVVVDGARRKPMRGRQMAEFYRTRFQRFVEGVRALEALQDQLVEEETATLGGESWEQCFGRSGSHGMDPTAWIREVAVHIRNRLISQASTEFAPPGSRLDISSEGLNAPSMIEV